MQHMWEVNHAYYCNEGNYYSNECVFEFKSWQDYLDEMGDTDMDYNLVFRWDWKEPKEDDEGNPIVFNGDVNYRNAILQFSIMHQRKGRYVVNLIEVCRADEPAVLEYLKPRWEYMKALWLPFES